MALKSDNSVHLDGMVESCRIVGQFKGKSVAKLSVITLHPKADLSASDELTPSKRFDKMRHVVRVVAAGDLAQSLRSLETSLKVERAVGSAETADLHPCSVDGYIASQDGENFIESREGGFRLTEKVKTKENNVAHVSGRVESVVYSNESARILVSTKEGDINSFFPKSLNRSGWDAIAEGRIKKGDVVSMSGPLIAGEFTDGKKTLRTYMVTPHVIQKLSLEKKVSSGPSL